MTGEKKQLKLMRVKVAEGRRTPGRFARSGNFRITRQRPGVRQSSGALATGKTTRGARARSVLVADRHMLEHDARQFLSDFFQSHFATVAVLMFIRILLGAQKKTLNHGRHGAHGKESPWVFHLSMYFVYSVV